MAQDLAYDRIMHTAIGFWSSKVLLSAVEIGVFGTLAAGPLDAASLRLRLGIHQRAARDFFDSLVTLGLLQRDDAGRYSNAPEAANFLDPARSSYIGGIIEMFNARLYGFWGSLTEALVTGEPQNEAKGGGDLFTSLRADPDRLEAFLRAMTGLSAPVADALAQVFPWRDVGSVIDVGSAQGCVPVRLALAHPHLSAGGFDLPEVGPSFCRYAETHGVSKRVRFIAGDFLRDELPPADERRAHLPGLLMSLNMLIETRGGFDFTGADCIGWMREAGFSEASVVPLSGAHSAVIGIK
jgi:hypothetical protein